MAKLIRIIALALLVLLNACSSKKPTPPLRGAHPDRQANQAASKRSDVDELPRVRRPKDGETRPLEERGAGDEEPAADIKRDLAAELRSALGDPSRCLSDFSAPTKRTIQIGINATVLSSGRIATATVSAAGLSTNARLCIERSAERVVLKKLEDDASQRVTLNLAVLYTPPVQIDDAPTVVPAPPTPRGVQQISPTKAVEIPRSGVPISNEPALQPTPAKADPIKGPSGQEISGPKGVPIEQGD